MKQLKSQQGFTLVELAIVMTIIGLLIGGILKGQELMENARVTSTIAQVRGYEGAVTTFRDTYSALPGDLPNSEDRLQNCAANCTASTGGTLGDQIIGTSGGMETDLSAKTSEPTKFWLHLAKANMISGVTESAMTTGGAVAWGETHPSASIGGGFHAKYGDGTANGPWAGGNRPIGNQFVMLQQVTGTPTATAGVQVLSPLRAAQIDRKMDDGLSRSGSIKAYGVDASCADGGPDNVSYDETSPNKDCGLSFTMNN